MIIFNNLVKIVKKIKVKKRMNAYVRYKNQKMHYKYYFKRDDQNIKKKIYGKKVEINHNIYFFPFLAAPTLFP